VYGVSVSLVQPCSCCAKRAFFNGFVRRSLSLCLLVANSACLFQVRYDDCFVVSGKCFCFLWYVDETVLGKFRDDFELNFVSVFYCVC
jgi:hypothetical protein